MLLSHSARTTPAKPLTAGRQTPLGRHAIVIGGSVAGLANARVLSDYFDRVTILERDTYPDHAQHRTGVPHANHLHALLARGLEIVEELFPGIRTDLVRSGAVEMRSGGDVAWLLRTGWGVDFENGPAILSFSRPLLDWHLRDRVNTIPNVRVIDNCDVQQLLVGPNGSVTGVRARFRSADRDEHDSFVVNADLVVDASGRRSKTPEWLAALGIEPPPLISLDASIGYASRVFRRPKNAPTDWKAAIVQLAPPERTRGGLIFEIEGDRWLVTLIGGGGDFPPTDPEGFTAFARSLDSSILADAIRDAEPLTNVVGYRNTANTRRQYELLRNMPDRFVVTGDAACAFNPVYGQGMSIALVESIALRDCLRARCERRVGVDHLGGLANEAQRAIAKVNSVAWTLATSEDYRFRKVQGPAPGLRVKFMHKYVDRVLALTTYDPAVRRTWIRTMMMLEPPTAIFAPSIVAKVLASPSKRPAQPMRARFEYPSHDPVRQV